jgi:hypothetical protein
VRSETQYTSTLSMQSFQGTCGDADAASAKPVEDGRIARFMWYAREQMGEIEGKRDPHVVTVAAHEAQRDALLCT